MRSTCRTNVANASRSTHRDAGSPKRSANAAVTVDYEGAYDEHVHRGPSRPSLRLLGRRARPQFIGGVVNPELSLRTRVSGIRDPLAGQLPSRFVDGVSHSGGMGFWKKKAAEPSPAQGGRRKKRTLRLSRKHTVACWVPLRTEQSQPPQSRGEVESARSGGST